MRAIEIGELLVGLRLIKATVPAAAGGSEVSGVKVMVTDVELYRFDVRVRHDER